MSLNIKNDDACHRPNERPRQTGRPKTATKAAVLPERPNPGRRQNQIEALAQELHEIGQRCARLLQPGPSAVEHGDLLYDKSGLPK